MNRFEKQVVGLAELLIAGTDCGALHGGNWRLPCSTCVEKERTVGSMLAATIQAESVRRHIRAGHDERDGNRSVKRAQPPKTEDEMPKVHYGIVDEVERNVFEVILDGEDDAKGLLHFFADKPGAYGYDQDDEGVHWRFRADLTDALPSLGTNGAMAQLRFMELRGVVIGILTGWRMAAEGG